MIQLLGLHFIKFLLKCNVLLLYPTLFISESVCSDHINKLKRARTCRVRTRGRDSVKVKRNKSCRRVYGRVANLAHIEAVTADGDRMSSQVRVKEVAGRVGIIPCVISGVR